jgi:hypothetical protein
LKYNAAVNEIGRAAKSVFKFEVETFPNDSMTSSRSKLIHDWVLTLAKQTMDNELRNRQLVQFIDLITPDEFTSSITKCNT